MSTFGNSQFINRGLPIARNEMKTAPTSDHHNGARLGLAPLWWSLVGAVFISFLAIGNPRLMNWLLPNVDIHLPASQPTGTTHLKWVGGAIMVSVLGVVLDILLR